MATTCTHGITFNLLNILQGGGCQDCKAEVEGSLRDRDEATLAKAQRRLTWLHKLNMGDVEWVQGEIKAARDLITITQGNLK